MNSVFLKVLILFLCFTLIGTVIMVATGASKDDFEPRTIRQFIEFFGKQDNFQTFDMFHEQASSWVDMLLDIRGLLDELSRLDLNMDGSSQWYDYVVSFIAILFTVIIFIIPIIVYFLTIFVALILDVIQTFVWLLEVFAFLFGLNPVS